MDAIEQDINKTATPFIPEDMIMISKQHAELIALMLNDYYNKIDNVLYATAIDSFNQKKPGEALQSALLEIFQMRYYLLEGGEDSLPKRKPFIFDPKTTTNWGLQG